MSETSERLDAAFLKIRRRPDMTGADIDAVEPDVRKNREDDKRLSPEVSLPSDDDILREVQVRIIKKKIRRKEDLTLQEVNRYLQSAG